MGGLEHVAIDGPAGSGKTTVAQGLARELRLLYLDTGAMYRAVARIGLDAGLDLRDEAALVAVLAQAPIGAEADPHAAAGFRIFAGERRFGDDLYANDVSRVVSTVAAHPRIRASLVDRQRAIAAERAVIMAGRDIGTVVLPDARFKFFLTASIDERVERRLREFAARGIVVDRATLRDEIETRDRVDRERAVSPLRPAADALEIDSTGLGITEVIDALAGRIRGTVTPRA